MIMEDLLWKYIDNECTSEEIEKIKVLLETDAAFKEQYKEYVHLDVILSKNVPIDISNEFRNKLEVSVAKAVVIKQVSLYNLLNIQWVAIALFCLLGAVIYYFADMESMEQSQLLSQFYSHFGNDTINLFNTVAISVVLLIILDWGLKHLSKLRSAMIL
jgi:hypothetical protein